MSDSRLLDYQAEKLTRTGILYGGASTESRLSASQDYNRRVPSSLQVWAVDEDRLPPGINVGEHERNHAKYCRACEKSKPFTVVYWNEDANGKHGLRTDKCRICRAKEEGRRLAHKRFARRR